MPEFSYVGEAVLIAKAMGALESAVGLAAEDLDGRAKAALADHVVTGTLKASIHVDGPHVHGQSVEAKVSTGGEADAYAAFVHEGTGAHEIRPKNAKALYFDGHFAKVVHHPGTAAVKYLERPLIELAPVYRAYLEKAVAEAF